MGSCRKICCLFILLFAAMGITVAHAQAPIMSEKYFDKADVPIYKSRIFTVSEDVRARAFAILGDKPFRLVDSDILVKIFPGQKFDEGRMLQEQIEAATAYAKKRELEAADPFFENQRVWMKDEAEVHKKLAEYTQGIHGKLKPYLIKLPVYFEGTGAFYVRLKGSVLYVVHGSLGHIASERHQVPVVVFTERCITEVKVDSSLAE